MTSYGTRPITLCEYEKHLEWLADLGFTISIACGRTPNYHYSVFVSDPAHRREFDRPLAARSLNHCLEVIESELLRREWITESMMRRHKKALQ